MKKWSRMPRFTTALMNCLLCSTELYCCPLFTTLRHIIGCFRPLSRGKAQHCSNKLTQELLHSRAKITAICCAFAVAGSLFLVSRFCISKPGDSTSLWQSVFDFRDRWKSAPTVMLRQPYRFFPSSVFGLPMLSLPLSLNSLQGAPLMEWVTPQHEEIDLNCEISSYANAEL